ncbi:MAG: acetyltransferase [Bacillota bacterium]
MTPDAAKKLAEAVRDACLKAAKQGYEEAAQSGLCHEGAVEASLDAVRMVDLKALVAVVERGKKPS